MEKISIIIPLYNKEKTIYETVNSCLSQDYTNIEVVVVDDGSTDATGAIADAYAARDSRVHVAHQKNSGTCIAYL